MSSYTFPATQRPAKAGKRQVLLIANGDLRLLANQKCWAEQSKMEQTLRTALQREGYSLVRAHPYKDDQGHGFIGSQKEGMEVFRAIDPKAPLIVAEAVWQYSHHILHGLISHKGPILTAANWSGTWPGLVGMLNLNGSLTKAGVKYSTIWSEDFTDDLFTGYLQTWLAKGHAKHKMPQVTKLKNGKIGGKERKLGEALAAQLHREKGIMGGFDEGCMGVFKANNSGEMLQPTR